MVSSSFREKMKCSNEVREVQNKYLSIDMNKKYFNNGHGSLYVTKSQGNLLWQARFSPAT